MNLNMLDTIQEQIAEWSAANFGRQVSKTKVTVSNRGEEDTTCYKDQIPQFSGKSVHLSDLVLGSLAPLMGIGEEIGEFNEALAALYYYSQNDHDTPNSLNETYFTPQRKKCHTEIEDALGDIAVYLCDYSFRETSLSIAECIATYIPEAITSSPFGIYKPVLEEVDKARLHDDIPVIVELGNTPPILSVIYSRLLHCTLKHHQGIRGYDDRKKYDDTRNLYVARLFCCLARICTNPVVVPSQKSIMLILANTWQNVVKKRNWKINPVSADKQPNVIHKNIIEGLDNESIPDAPVITDEQLSK